MTVQVEKPERIRHGRSPTDSARAAAIPALTSIRFFLAMTVIAVHYDGLLRSPACLEPVRAANHILLPGFFCLSGFVLSLGYGNFQKSTVFNYLAARFARIVPLYWFCLFLAMAVGPLQYICETNLPLAVCACLFLMQSWIPDYRFFWAFNPPMYSLSSEAFLYVVFPFMAMRGLGTRIICLAASLVLPVFFHSLNLGRTFELFSWVCPLTSTFPFFAGVLLADLFRHLRKAMPGNLNYVTASFLEIAGVALYVFSDPICRLWDWHVAPDAYSFEKAFTIKCFATLAFGFFACGAAFQSGCLSRILANKWLVTLGGASYAMYLLHDIFLRALVLYSIPWKETGILGFIVFCLFVVSLALLCHLKIELPWRKCILALRSRKKSARSEYSLALLSCAFLPLLVVSWMAITNRFPTYHLFDTMNDAIADRYDTSRTTVRTRILFGDYLRLRKIGMKKIDDGILVETFWTAEKACTNKEWLCVHALDKSGKIVKNLDHVLSGAPVASGAAWRDAFVVPADVLSGTQSLGLCVCPDPEHLVTISGGTCDWGNKRLLIPFQHSAPPSEEVRQRANRAI